MSTFFALVLGLIILALMVANMRLYHPGCKQPPNPPPSPQSHKRPPHSPLHQWHHGADE